MSALVGVLVLAGGRGTRLPPSGPWTKHLEPIPGMSGTTSVLDVVLDGVSSADQIVVATGYRYRSVEQHIARRWPGVLTARVSDIDNLSGSAAEVLSCVDAARVVVVEGDVLTPKAQLARFLRAKPGEAALELLVGPKPARRDRLTFDQDSHGNVCRVRAVSISDQNRWSVLAAAPNSRLREELPQLARPTGAMGRATGGMWHYVAAQLIERDMPVRLHLAPNGGVNVNTHSDLHAAAAYLQQSRRSDDGV